MRFGFFLFKGNIFVVKVDAERLRSRFGDADITIAETGALCSFYAEQGGVLIGYEGNKKY